MKRERYTHMIRMKIGDREYSRTVINNNIKKTYKFSLDTEFNNWYQEANDFGIGCISQAF